MFGRMRRVIGIGAFSALGGIASRPSGDPYENDFCGDFAPLVCCECGSHKIKELECCQQCRRYVCRGEHNHVCKNRWSFEGKQEFETILRELAAATKFEPDYLAGHLVLQNEQFPTDPIVVHLLGTEWIPEWLKQKAKTHGDATSMSKPCKTFEEFKELEDEMQRRLSARLSENRMQLVEQKVAKGGRVAVFHFHKTLMGQTGIWSVTVTNVEDT